MQLGARLKFRQVLHRIGGIELHWKDGSSLVHSFSLVDGNIYLYPLPFKSFSHCCPVHTHTNYLQLRRPSTGCAHMMPVYHDLHRHRKYPGPNPQYNSNLELTDVKTFTVLLPHITIP